MRCSYGQTIAWQGPDGPAFVTVGGHLSPSDALRAAVEMAWEAGWRPRRFWEIHRWNEPMLPRGYRRYLPRRSMGAASQPGT